MDADNADKAAMKPGFLEFLDSDMIRTETQARMIMSLATAASPLQLVFASNTVRQFGRAVRVALIAVLVGCLIYAIEKYAFQPQTRFIENPADVMMRAFALAHFLIGWLFLFTSARLRNRRALLRLAMATLAGIGLCLVFAQFGGTANPLLVMFFYGYFLVHEVRDETRLYQIYDDAQDRDAMLPALSRTATLLFMTVLAVAYFLYQAATDKRTALDHMPPVLFGFLMAGLVALFGWSLVRLARLVHRTYGDFRGLILEHLPLMLVYGGILVILVAGSFFGSTGFNLIILIHVTAWLVFTQYQLSKRPQVMTKNPWTWLRTHPLGFWVLHVGLAVAVLGLMAVRVHVWERVGFASELLASSNFCYWGLMHISMSFWSSR